MVSGFCSRHSLDQNLLLDNLVYNKPVSNFLKAFIKNNYCLIVFFSILTLALTFNIISAFVIIVNPTLRLVILSSNDKFFK